ncbi:hypothetical protein DS906_09820 [Ruegeria sp. A3M17]|nr:hypothetical protein DS906_09820 [Ruegeria sp. A3M17]
MVRIVGKTHHGFAGAQIESLGKVLQSADCVLRFPCVWCFDNQRCVRIHRRQNCGDSLNLLRFGDIMAT